jgi:hypothetical protein
MFETLWTDAILAEDHFIFGYGLLVAEEHIHKLKKIRPVRKGGSSVSIHAM